MDIDATLAQIRAYRTGLAQATDVDDFCATVEALSAEFELLDDWLSAGGTKPVAWQH